MIPKIQLTKENLFKIVLRFGLLAIGGLLDGLGVAMQIKANWGPDPMSLFYDGIHQFFGITTGQAYNVVVCTFIALAIVINFRQLGFGTVIVPFFVKIGIDQGLNLMTFELSRGMNLVLLAAGIIVLALGVATIVVADMGKGAFDAFVLGVMERLNTKYYKVRRPIDLIFLVGGIMMGGTFSATTVIIAFIIGPVISFAIDFFKKVVGNRLELSFVHDQDMAI